MNKPLPLLAVLGLMSLWMGAGSAFAQSPAQLLQGLSPAERAALLEGAMGEGALGSSSDVANSRTEAERNAMSSIASQDDVEASERVVPKLMAGDTVVLEVDFIRNRPERLVARGGGLPPLVIPARRAPSYDAAEQRQLQDEISALRDGNPYKLNDRGELLLPGFAPIALGGLDEWQASLRLSSDPALAKLEISLTQLPLDKTGVDRLQRFGFELFRDSPSTFAAVTDIPIPMDYRIGPGDQLAIQLFGAQDRLLTLQVDREGRVNFPELGPISVGGLAFSAAREVIESRVSEQMIGVRASVGLRDTRAIQVLVVGDAKTPGTYTLSGLATVTSAIYAAGGVAETGSLRQIEVKRGGTRVALLDLYDLLLSGDASSDLALQSGDVVFVAPLGDTVAVDGAVVRPAIYEIGKGETLESVLALAGGLTAESDAGAVTVIQANSDGLRAANFVSAADATDRKRLIRGGAELIARRLSTRVDNGVFIEGHAENVGVMPWFEGMRATDLLPSLAALKPKADARYIVIRRESPSDQRITVRSFDLLAALAAPDSTANPTLQPRDQLLIFDGSSDRVQTLGPLLDELRLQASLEQPVRVVSISGRVRWPGSYPLEEGMRLSDLVRAAGGLRDDAFTEIAELVRYVIAGRRDRASSSLLEVDLASMLAGHSDADIALQSQDSLVIKPVPENNRGERISIRGEVRFPGEYPIQRGETLRSVIERAGGLTGLAFARGAVFTRSELKRREQERIDELDQRLQRDLSSTLLGSLQGEGGAGAASTVSQAFSLLDRLQSTAAVGRLVIDLQDVLANDIGAPQDIVLRDGDELVIPTIPQEVTVLGEVQLSTSHLYSASLSTNDYVALSGGTTARAKESAIYVIKADGRVEVPNNRWFRAFASQRAINIQPGDTIIVPPDVEKLPPLPFWQAVTSIIYNAAVAVAAINSF